MDSINIRYCLNLRRSESQLVRAGLLALCLLGIATGSQAQGYAYQRKHLEFYDDRPIHYGFFFAAPVTRFNVKYSNAFLADSATRIYSPSKVSFRVGLVVNGYISDRFDLRFTPSVSLYGREVRYEYGSSSPRSEIRESTWMDFPVLLKYKSERRMNSRMYLLAGGSYAVETNVRKREAQGSGRLSTNTADFSVEYGIGFEQFLEYTKFTPELRFSHGVTNLFRATPNAATDASIRRLTTHSVTLFLIFE